jgi:hypothetical protein
VSSSAKTLLAVAAAAAVGLLVWAYYKSKSSGGSTGIWGTISGLWGGATNIATDGTNKAVAAGETVGGGVKDAANGVISIIDKAGSTATHILTLGIF